VPEIGATLREARMRARIDISEIESETKIRAKYLRALENEEWDLLPGPAYVKSFLRTYAQALGLDAKLLIEEYKLRHERPSEQDLQPIVPRTTAGRRRPEPPGVPRGYVVAGVVLVLLAAVYALGLLGGDDDPGQANTVVTDPPATATGGATTTGRAAPARPRLTAAQRRARRTVRLQIVPTGPVNVCLEAAGRGRILNGVTLQPGGTPATYRSSRFDVTLGNGDVTLRLDRRSFEVPDVGDGIGYRIVKRDGKVRRSTLSPADRPVCG
jgi:transcriptional regulator with XRE-family HTH domain